MTNSGKSEYTDEIGGGPVVGLASTLVGGTVGVEFLVALLRRSRRIVIVMRSARTRMGTVMTAASHVLETESETGSESESPPVATDPEIIVSGYLCGERGR
jgi:hypothetical protein